MKKLLLTALALTCALLLYNCSDDNDMLLNTANQTLDSLQPGDSIFYDSISYRADSVYIPVDTITAHTADNVPVPVATPFAFYPLESAN
jgi:hypothetical protein